MLGYVNGLSLKMLVSLNQIHPRMSLGYLLWDLIGQLAWEQKEDNRVHSHETDGQEQRQQKLCTETDRLTQTHTTHNRDECVLSVSYIKIHHVSES